MATAEYQQDYSDHERFTVEKASQEETKSEEQSEKEKAYS